MNCSMQSLRTSTEPPVQTFGRPGMTYWSILVLGAVRLGCNFDYDRLQNLAEEHRSLRQVMGIGGWCDDQTYDWRCLRDNICLLSPDTIERVNHLIVAEGHRLVPRGRCETVRGDSFRSRHQHSLSTDSRLIFGDDFSRQSSPWRVRSARTSRSRLAVGGGAKHLLRTVKKPLRGIRQDRQGRGARLPQAASGAVDQGRSWTWPIGFWPGMRPCSTPL